jgi:hypothetical protein
LFRDFPRREALSAMPDRVTARIKIRPVGLDVIDDLIESGDLDPLVRDEIPTFDVGRSETLEWTADAVTQTYLQDGLPVRCVSNTNLNAAADKVPAPEHEKCGR